MYFNDDFFRDEVRNNFYVSGLMKRVWAAQLEVLQEIDRVCRKHNIRWFADSGTLLGAVRHKGFIPWDDDIDIVMLREDYEKFLMVADYELKEYCKLLDMYKEDPFYYLFARVVNTNDINTNNDFLDKYHQVFFSVGVDIFPLDYISDDEELENARYDVICVLSNLLYELENNPENENQIAKDNENVIFEIEEISGVTLNKSQPIRQQIYILMDSMCKYFDNIDGNYVTKMVWHINNRQYKCLKSSYLDVDYLDFECIKMPVPVNYENPLVWMYGENYMEMKIGVDAAHTYPYFIDEEVAYKSGTWFDMFSYKYDKIHVPNGLINKGSNTNELHSGIQRIDDRKNVVFICYSSKYWHRYEKLWREHVSNGDSVYVIPIPCYDRLADGSLSKESYGIEDYPEYINCLNYMDYDLESMKPDIIYIQNPYDQYNYTTSIKPQYYISRIREYTKELIYIPYFEMKKIDMIKQPVKQTMRYFCNTPGVFNADKILLDTEDTRVAYIEYLVEITGEENRQIWENKICVI